MERRAQRMEAAGTRARNAFESAGYVTPLSYVPRLVLKKVMLESNCPPE
jgi:hypothetical protein